MVQAVWVIEDVTGNQLTLNVDSRASDSYRSGGILNYVGSAHYSNALRGAGKLAANLEILLKQDYDLFLSAGGEFPSCFQFANLPPPPGSDIWSILDDVYQPLATSPQARAIQEFNAF
jgi:hypothetical protein